MDEGQRLLVTFEARLNKYERDLERSKGKSRTNFRAIQKEAETAGSGIERAMGGAMKTLGSFGKGLLGGIAGGLAVGGLEQIIGRVGELAKGVATIGNEAKRAGLNTKAFQELSYVAQQNRIEVDALVDGMKELNLRADEFIVTGKGSAAEAFQRLGYGADELKRKLADPSALLVEIIGKLEHLDRAAQIRIADELFGGTGGERFVELLDRGAEGIRKTIKEANDLGVVMDDKLIQRADEFNRKWSAVGTTIGTTVKQAVLGLAFAADDFLDSFNKVEEQTTRNVEDRLISLYDKIAAERQRLADLQQVSMGTPTDVMNMAESTKEIERLQTEALRLRDILDRRNGYDENFIYKTGQDANGAKPPVDNLNSALSGSGNAAAKAVSGLNSYTDAIRALKEEVPELAASLKDMDAKAKIDAIHRLAVSRAQGQREVALANEMRGQALASLNIRSATDDPTRYLSSMLASGKAQSHIDGMANTFAEKLAKMLASMPDDLKGSVTINSGYRSIERQQEIYLDTIKKRGAAEARKWAAPPGKSQHNKGNAADLGYGSDAARQWVHQNAGNYGLSFPLSNENWHIEDSTARGQQTASEIEKLTAAAKQQSDAYGQIITGSKEYAAAQDTERQALAMSGQQAAAFRFEQQMLAESQRNGITLTDQQRQEISNLAQGMASADASVQNYVASQEQAAEVSRFFGEQAVDALSGLLSGTMSAEQALQGLVQTLIRAALQAAILGEGPLAGLLGGNGNKPKVPSGGGGKKAGGSLLGAILGLKDGGHVRGPGTATSDSIPARLSNGEFVVNAKATRKNRAVLEAINNGSVAAFASGGYAGDAPALRKPGLIAANSNAPTGSPVNINTTVSVNATGGEPGQNAELAARVGKQVEQQMRSVVADELRRQTKVGNYMNQRAR